MGANIKVNVHTPSVRYLSGYLITLPFFPIFRNSKNAVNNALVIIPTYNEKENIEMIVQAVFSLPKDFDLLIVDDNSPDGTAQIVKDLQTKHNSTAAKLHLLQREGKQGLGTAYIAGFRFGLEHGYDYLLEMDADFSHDPKDLTLLYLACAEGAADLSIGSRYLTGVNVVNWPMSRVLLSYFASYYVRLITGMPIHDTTAGFVCYRRRVLDVLLKNKIRFAGYGFQIEMKFNTWKHGFKIKEVPIIFTERVRGQSKLSVGIFKEAFFGVIQLKMQSWFRKYSIESR